MKNWTVSEFLIALVFVFLGSAHGAESQEAALERDQNGVVIHKDFHVKIPEGQKVYQTGPNVIRVESDVEYKERLISEFKAEIDERLAKAESRITALEERSGTLADAVKAKPNEKSS